MNLVPLQNITLTKSGLEILKKILLSSPNCKFKPKIILRKKAINMSDLNQLVPSGAALSLYFYAVKTKKYLLSDADVIFCFSSKDHLDRVKYRTQVNKEKLKEKGLDIFDIKARWRYYLTHLLLPVKVTNYKEHKLSTLYNGRILFKNIFSEKEQKNGDWILVHFGKFIQKIDGEAYVKILEKQSKIFLPKILNKRGASDKILDFENDFGINLWQYHKNNYQKYHL